MPKLRGDLHMRETVASAARSWRTLSASTKLVRSGHFDEIDEFHKAGSEIDYVDQMVMSDEDYDDMMMSGASRKPFWKETLRQVSRESAKNALRKIDNKVRYLPNPRLDAIRNGQL